MKLDAKEVLEFGVERRIKSMWKLYLTLLADLQEDYDLSDKDVGRIRKKILDHGNDVLREFYEEIKLYNIELK